MTIELIKFLGLSLGPVIILGFLYVVFGNKKDKIKKKNPLLDNENK